MYNLLIFSLNLKYLKNDKCYSTIPNRKRVSFST